MPPVGGTVADRKDGYPGNLTSFVTVACIVAAMGDLIFGYIFKVLIYKMFG